MAKAISEGVSAKHASRIMLYSDSKGKREVIDRFKHKSSIDMVIIGPSLFDGLSFDYDLCRFLVIAKVPYPDLSSKFVKKKMEKNHDWYASQAALSIVQGVGRGVRAEDDWCVSYILDGCFPYLLRQTLGMFNTTISNRFRLLEYRDLLNKI
jgi:Rad3-related DNA helicase